MQRITSTTLILSLLAVSLFVQVYTSDADSEWETVPGKEEITELVQESPTTEFEMLSSTLYLEEPPSHAQGQTGGFRDAENIDDHELAYKVEELVMEHLNNQLLSCGHKLKGHLVEHVKVEEMHTQVVVGTEVHAVVVATRKDGMTHRFSVDARRQQHHHPKTGPSDAVAGVGAGLKTNKWSIHSITPPACSHWISGEDPFASLTEEQWKGKLGYIKPPKHTVLEHDVQITDAERAALPKDFSWRTSKYKDTDKPLDCAAYGSALNQGGCGSCWAFAASTVISSRFCVQTGGKTNPVIAPQWITSCGKAAGCQGGWMGLGMQAMQAKDWDAGCKERCPKGDRAPKFLGGAVVRKCNPYTGKDASQGQKCNNNKSGKKIPDSCFRYYSLPATPYGKQNPYWQWHIGGNNCNTKYGKPCDIAKIQKEIMTNGPLFASMKVMSDFSPYKSGVYTHKSGSKRGMHAITVLGWGTEDGVDYWACQNSWGDHWGDHGYFKIKRGVNEVGIDTAMMAATPFLKGLCHNKCDHGDFDKQCNCACHHGWGGKSKACDECVLSCKGDQYSGKRDDKICQCECKKGYFGEACQLKMTIPAEVVSGKKFDIEYKDTGKKVSMKKGDKISIFPADATIWSKKDGWAKASTDPVKLSGDASAKISTTLYKPGKYHVVKLNWLGVNEFGQDKGYGTTFIKLGSIKVADCGKHCAPQPPLCKDKITFCRAYKRWCKYASRVNMRYQVKRGGPIKRGPLNKLCPKTCVLCGPGAKEAAKARKDKEMKRKAQEKKQKKKWLDMMKKYGRQARRRRSWWAATADAVVPEVAN